MGGLCHVWEDGSNRLHNSVLVAAKSVDGWLYGDLLGKESGGETGEQLCTTAVLAPPILGPLAVPG